MYLSIRIYVSKYEYALNEHNSTERNFPQLRFSSLYGLKVSGLEIRHLYRRITLLKILYLTDYNVAIFFILMKNVNFCQFRLMKLMFPISRNYEVNSTYRGRYPIFIIIFFFFLNFILFIYFLISEDAIRPEHAKFKSPMTVFMNKW